MGNDAVVQAEDEDDLEFQAFGGMESQQGRGVFSFRQRILVEGPSRRNPGELAGRTGCNRVVNFAGDATLIGEFVEVEITEALSHSLRGCLPGEPVRRAVGA